ncbi:hypothetical protein GCM10011499_21860 [Pelagibacterium lentulum]|uniref:Uncharacterized protein n=1 Tax=Pelagibacterium lentulum TaxID=2029865 RepID=A0A916RBH5_9HYPH|nr:hypothetical protein GCM10011499_21860 [Pelagibacterium lentulum]
MQKSRPEAAGHKKFAFVLAELGLWSRMTSKTMIIGAALLLLIVIAVTYFGTADINRITGPGTMNPFAS